MDLISPPITVPLEPLTFSLRRAAKEYPEKVAVIEPEKGRKEYSYQWLEENSSALAASLAGMGVEPDDRIALWMRNSMEYILSFYGILKAGGVVVPISIQCGKRKVLHQLRETGVKGMISVRLVSGMTAKESSGFLALKLKIPGTCEAEH